MHYLLATIFLLLLNLQVQARSTESTSGSPSPVVKILEEGETLSCTTPTPILTIETYNDSACADEDGICTPIYADHNAIAMNCFTVSRDLQDLERIDVMQTDRITGDLCGKYMGSPILASGTEG